jgi:pyruvate kinase
VDVNYQDLVNDINVGDTVLVDNGLIRLEVLEKRTPTSAAGCSSPAS